MQDLTKIYKVSAEIIKEYQAILNSEGYENSSFSPPVWNVQFNGSIYQLTLHVPPYWKYVEYGTPPHEIIFQKKRKLHRKGKEVGEIMGPPIEVLANWLSQSPADRKSANTVLTVKRGVPGGVAVGKAIAIEKKLAKNNGRSLSHPGFNGKHMLERTLNDNKDLIKELADEIVKLITHDATTELKTVFSGLDHFRPVNVK